MDAKSEKEMIELMECEKYDEASFLGNSIKLCDSDRFRD